MRTLVMGDECELCWWEAGRKVLPHGRSDGWSMWGDDVPPHTLIKTVHSILPAGPIRIRYHHSYRGLCARQGVRACGQLKQQQPRVDARVRIDGLDPPLYTLRSSLTYPACITCQR